MSLKAIFPALRHITVNYDLVRQMMGHEIFKISVIDYPAYYVGERIVIVAENISMAADRDIILVRYVTRIEPVIPLMLDEDYLNIWVSPFIFDTERLGLSGVQ